MIPFFRASCAYCERFLPGKVSDRKCQLYDHIPDELFTLSVFNDEAPNCYIGESTADINEKHKKAEENYWAGYDCYDESRIKYSEEMKKLSTCFTETVRRENLKISDPKIKILIEETHKKELELRRKYLNNNEI